jgi:hypothetical protein
MSSRHHERIRRLVAWMRNHALTRTPLVVFHSPALPVTPKAEIDAARAEGRTIVNVRFVEPTAPGLAPECEEPRPARSAANAEVM